MGASEDVGAFFGNLLGVVGPAIPGPFGRAMTYTSNSLNPNVIPSPPELLAMRYRGILNDDELTDQMKAQGYDEKRTGELFTMSSSVLDAANIVRLSWREKWDDDVFHQKMARLGYSEIAADDVRKAMAFLPGPADIVRFAVREVTDPKVVEDFGLDEGVNDPFFSDLEAIAAKVGMTPETLKLYWRAKWQMPSPTMLTEMFHRLNPDFESETPVSQTEYQRALKIADVMPYWIPRMEKVLYSLPTRVDVRRMLRDGIIDREQTLTYYRKMGYAPEEAERLTRLAETFYQDSEREVTKAIILQALEVGELSAEDAQAMLIELGYPEDDAMLIMSVKLAQLDEKDVKARLSVLTSQYVRGVISEGALGLALDQLDITATRRDKEMEDARVKREGKVRMPNKDDIKAFLKAGAVAVPTAKTLLKEAGVRDVDVPRYLKAWGMT